MVKKIKIEKEMIIKNTKKTEKQIHKIQKEK